MVCSTRLTEGATSSELANVASSTQPRLSRNRTAVFALMQFASQTQAGQFACLDHLQVLVTRVNAIRRAALGRLGWRQLSGPRTCHGDGTGWRPSAQGAGGCGRRIRVWTAGPTVHRRRIRLSGGTAGSARPERAAHADHRRSAACSHGHRTAPVRRCAPGACRQPVSGGSVPN